MLRDLLSDTGTRFEFECYDTAHLYNLAHFLDRGLVKPPLFVQTVFGILGGIGPHPEDVMHMKRTADRLFGDQLSLVGAGRRRATRLPIAAQAAAMGGNVRVGLEDSLWAGPGKLAKSQRRAGARGAPDHRRARPRGRDARRGARDPGAEGRRQGRVLSGEPPCCASNCSSTLATELGEGPLVGRRRAAALLDRQSRRQASIRCDADGGEPRELARARAHRLDGAAARAAARSCRCATASTSLDFETGECRAPRSRSRQAAHPAERRQGRPAGPLRRRLHGLRGARPALRAVPARSRPDAVTKLDDGIICSNGPCWSPDGRTFYFADTCDARHLGL